MHSGKNSKNDTSRMMLRLIFGSCNSFVAVVVVLLLMIFGSCNSFVAVVVLLLLIFDNDN